MNVLTLRPKKSREVVVTGNVKPFLPLVSELETIIGSRLTAEWKLIKLFKRDSCIKEHNLLDISATYTPAVESLEASQLFELLG